MQQGARERRAERVLPPYARALHVGGEGPPPLVVRAPRAPLALVTARRSALRSSGTLRRQTKGSKIEGKMRTKWHGFMATDTIQNPALMPKYTTILHVAKAGRGLRVYAERLESPTEAGYAHLSVEMCPKGYPLMGQNYTL